jgi:hypothetical protein
MTTVTTDIGAASESLEVPFMPISGIQATNAQDAIQAVARASGGWLNIVMTSANVSPADTRTLYVVTGATGPFTIDLPVSAVANDSVAVYMHDYTSNVIVTVDAGVSGVIADFGRTHRLGVQHTFAVYRCIAPQMWFIEWDQSAKELRYRASNATIGVVHGNSLLYMDSSLGARTITVPSDAADPLPVGFQTEVMRYGVNSVTLVADTGVTIDNDGPLALPHLYSRGVLTKINANEWTFNLYGGALVNVRADIPSLKIRDPYFKTKDGATWIPGTSTGPMAIQDAAAQWWQLDLSLGSMATWFGAVADNGVTDNHAAFLLADARGAFTIPVGIFGVNSNTTITHEVTAMDGGQIKVAAGFTLSLTGGLSAGNVLVFTGTGAVSGLTESRAEWFSRDLLNTNTDATARLQLWLNSVVQNGTCRMGPGTLGINGVTALSATTGQRIYGAGGRSSKLFFAGTATNGVSFSGGVQGAGIFGVGFNTAVTNAIPASGDVLSISSSVFTSDDVIIQHGFNGIHFSGAHGVRFTKLAVYNCMNSAIWADNSGDIYINNFLIDAETNWIGIASQIGTFSTGETVNFSPSGATGVIGSIVSGYLIVTKKASIVPLSGDTVSGVTSLASALVSSVSRPHQAGAIALTNVTESFSAQGGDIIGGVYSLVIDGTALNLSHCPAFNSFTDVYFDSSDLGAVVNKGISNKFTKCWFSNRPSTGCALVSAIDTSFIDCWAINNGQDGLLIGAGATQTTVIGGSYIGNSVSNSGVYSGIHVQAGASDFTITNVQGGNAVYGAQLYDVRVDAGASNNYVISNISNNNGLVFDGGTGTNKVVEKYQGATYFPQRTITVSPDAPSYIDEYILIGTAGACTINLPSIASRNGKPLRIKDMSGLTGHTINRNGTDVFEGGFTSFVFYTPYQGQSFIPTTIGGIKTWAVM